MVEHAGTEFCLLAARAVKKTVVNDKCIHTVIRCERLDYIDHLPGQEGGKAQPVRFRTVQETIERILGERFLEGAGLLLHVHAAVGKDVAELVLEDVEYRNTFFFLSIALAEKITDPESGKK